MFQHKCQPLLKFHEKDAVCDYEQAVPACQSSSSSSSSGSSNSASSDVTQGPAPPAVPTSSVPNIETLPTFTCRGKTDGDYRLFPCSRNYIKCVDGRYQLQACPGELRFDGKTRRCDAQARVDTCERLVGISLFSREKETFSDQHPACRSRSSSPFYLVCTAGGSRSSHWNPRICSSGRSSCPSSSPVLVSDLLLLFWPLRDLPRKR